MNDVYFLVGIRLSTESIDNVEDSMKELEGLVKTAGGTVVGSLIQNRNAIDPASYLGKGKLEEVHLLFDYTEDQQAAIVVNASISASQVRNIEEIVQCRVITRTELILDIFALHAKSKIAQLQVESAQLAYMLPRLIGSGAEMSRTGGGIGTRGPGETKLETDRRKIRNRIAVLRKELKKLEISSQERRKTRQNIFKVSIAGYTNAGKSFLASRLVRDQLYTKDQLFSTIDTTTRKLRLGGIPAVLTDTVGFIRDIPHALVESFRSTLEETIYADLVLHVVDISSPFYKEQIHTAQVLMSEIKVKSPVTMVYNKIDLLSPEELISYKNLYPDAFFVSAKSNHGIEDLITFLKNESEKFLSNRD